MRGTSSFYAYSLPSLRRDPNKSLVIQIIKDRKTDLTKMKKVEVLQPNSQNIWCISSRPLSIAKYISLILMMLI